MDEPSPDRLTDELSALRQLVESELARTRDELTERFSRFSSDVQSAYQQLRDELTGQQRLTLALLTALVDQAIDLERLAQAVPNEAVAVAARAAAELSGRFGVHRYRPAAGERYRPTLHERVGIRVEPGVEADRVAETVEPGYVCEKPELVVRRAKVIVAG